MPRHPTSTSGYPRPLVATTAILVILALLPSRWTGFVSQFNTLATLVVAPVGGPVARLTRWILPRAPRGVDTQALARAEEEAARWKLLYFQALATVKERDRQIQDLTNNRLIPNDAAVVLFPANVIGTSPDPAAGLLTVAAGRRDGVEVNTIAVVDTQLAGRVESVDELTCRVRLITSTQDVRQIPAVICVGDDPSEWLECNLFRQPGGVLRGAFTHRAGLSDRVKVGQEVRLTDAKALWPPSAKLLLVGMVTEVQALAGQQARYVVVRPSVDRLDLVSEVILRIPVPDVPGGTKGAPGETGNGGAPR